MFIIAIDIVFIIVIIEFQVGHEGVARWTRNVDIFSYDLLLVILTTFVTPNKITFINIIITCS